MFIRTFSHSANASVSTGSGRRAGQSIFSNHACREPGSLVNARSLSRLSGLAMSRFNASREKKVRWRSAARIQRSTSCTPTSALALSRGRCRPHRHAVMVRQVGVRGVEIGLVVVGPGDAAAQVVRNNDLGGGAESGDPQHGHGDLCLANLAGAPGASPHRASRPRRGAGRRTRCIGTPRDGRLCTRATTTRVSRLCDAAHGG